MARFAPLFSSMVFVAYPLATFEPSLERHLKPPTGAAKLFVEACHVDGIADHPHGQLQPPSAFEWLEGLQIRRPSIVTRPCGVIIEVDAVAAIHRRRGRTFTAC